MQPLAELLRPKNLSEVIGQRHLVAPDAPLNRLLQAGKLTSMIFWGPPGVGKTTLANILINSFDCHAIKLSAVFSGVKDIKEALEQAEANAAGLFDKPTVLFVDEIHRFNKAQQDAFLPHVENGTITLIGATTENPSFEVIGPLLSRSRVVVLQKLTADAMTTILKKARKSLKLTSKQLPDKTIQAIVQLADGDARRALGVLELARTLAGKVITPEIAAEAAQKPLVAFDKNGEMHYDLISAFIKSMRGSDVNASLYYAARILEGGEDPKFLARRMIIFASEDIGIAASPALNLAVSTFLAVERIGMPECQYVIFHCVTVLAGAKKSRAVTNAMYGAQAAVREHGNLAVPLHLRNAPTKLMKDLNYGKGYKWEADFQHPEGFLPPDIKDLQLF